MDKWISVDERLPEKAQNTYVSGSCNFKNKKKEFKGFYHYGDNKWCNADPPYHKGLFNTFIYGVTHWKPIIHNQQETDVWDNTMDN